jgi:hypothetical protein
MPGPADVNVSVTVKQQADARARVQRFVTGSASSVRGARRMETAPASDSLA